MSTRRHHLTGLGLAAAGLTLAAAQPEPPPEPSPEPPPEPPPAPPPEPPPAPPPGTLALTAYRSELTLPDLPALGLTYICRLDLFDQEGTAAGTAAAGATVVGVLPGPVVLAHVVLQLTDGEIHYQRLMDRFGDFPRAATGPIVGGTGAYRDLRGEVDISWPDPDQIDLLVRPVEG